MTNPFKEYHVALGTYFVRYIKTKKGRYTYGEDIVDSLLTVGTARRVPSEKNTDEGQTAVAVQHWTGALKNTLSAHY